MSAPPGRESRPGGEPRATNVSADDLDAAIMAPPTDAQIRARRGWAMALIRRAPKPPPSYGSAAWLALPEGSPERIASVVIAAENWAQDGDELEERLRREVEALRAAFLRDQKAAEDAEFRAAREEHRQAWTGTGFRPDSTVAADIAAEWQRWAQGEGQSA